jgi:hypothetical protein
MLLIIFIQETRGKIYLQEDALFAARRSTLPYLYTSSLAHEKTALNTRRIGE